MDVVYIHRQLDKHYPDVLSDLIMSYLTAPLWQQQAHIELTKAHLKTRQPSIANIIQSPYMIRQNVEYYANLIASTPVYIMKEDTSEQGWDNPKLTASEKAQLTRAFWIGKWAEGLFHATSTPYLFRIRQFLVGKYKQTSREQLRPLLLENYMFLASEEIMQSIFPDKFPMALPRTLVESIPANIDIIMDTISQPFYVLNCLLYQFIYI